MADNHDDRIRLPELPVFKRFSLALRQEFATAEEVLAVLDRTTTRVHDLIDKAEDQKRREAERESTALEIHEILPEEGPEADSQPDLEEDEPIDLEEETPAASFFDEEPEPGQTQEFEIAEPPRDEAPEPTADERAGLEFDVERGLPPAETNAPPPGDEARSEVDSLLGPRPGSKSQRLFPPEEDDDINAFLPPEEEEVSELLRSDEEPISMRPASRRPRKPAKPKAKRGRPAPSIVRVSDEGKPLDAARRTGQSKGRSSSKKKPPGRG